MAGVRIKGSDYDLEPDDEFANRVTSMMKELTRRATERYPHASKYENVVMYVGPQETRLGQLNASLANTIWHLYHRIIEDNESAGEQEIEKIPN
jgi:hypothetical protein